MSRTYSIDRAGGITTIRLHRRLELAEVLEVINEVAHADDCPRRLWDLSHNFHFTPGEIRAIAAHGRELWPAAARVAYLASDDLSFGLLRMFEVFREQESYETRVFRDEAEARQWLEGWDVPAGMDRPVAEPDPRAAPAERFVADGELRSIEAEVRSRYQTELEFAGWFKRALLELRIRREVASKVGGPPDVLWASSDRPPPGGSAT